MSEPNHFIIISKTRGASTHPAEQPDLRTATEEAKRLLDLDPNVDEEFTIYQAVRIVRPLQRHEVVELEDIPF